MTDYQGENPFEEPETNNPFEDSEDHTQPSFQPSAPALPPKDRGTTYTVQPTSQPVSQPQDFRNNADLVARAERLRQKEQALKSREVKLEQKEEYIHTQEKNAAPKRPPNWPRCKPLIHHDIKEDIPEKKQSLVRFAYLTWLASLWTLMVNIICLFVVMVEDGGGKAIGDFILAIVFLFFLGPVWFVIYRLLYRGARKGKASFYLLFLIMFWFVCATYIYFCVGFPSTGAAGLFYMINMFKNEHMIAAIFCIVALVHWVLLAVLGIVIWFKARIQYKEGGGLSKAQEEARKEAIKKAKENPELLEQGIKAGASAAAEHPEWFVEGAKRA